MFNDSPHAVTLEHLLMISGVEPNLRRPNKLYYEGWTHNASRLIWPSIGVVEAFLSRHVKGLL